MAGDAVLRRTLTEQRYRGDNMNLKKPPKVIDISAAMRFKARANEAAQRRAAEAEQAERKREQMRKYIQLTNIPPAEKNRIDLTTDEVRAILTAADQWEMIILAYNTGLARGYRAGKRHRQQAPKRGSKSKETKSNQTNIE